MSPFPVKPLLRRALPIAAALGLLALAGLAAWRLYRPPPRTPIYARSNLLVNPGFRDDADGDRCPDGWGCGPAAELSDWTIRPEPGGHSLRLTGSNSFVRSAAVTIWPGKRYRLTLSALTDAPTPNRLQAVFLWEDTRREVILRQSSPWLEAPARAWRTLTAEATGPAGAAGLTLLLRPAGDDPLYIDDVHMTEEGVRLEPLPDYNRAALAITLDWETAMGGLIHSRSGDGYDRATAEQRGLAMRTGTTNLLRLFQEYDIRATWYASGYALLVGNPDAQPFSGNPTYAWATRANGWPDDRWATTPWFADDPHGTAATHPAWYFGDLLAELQARDQDIQSHTFGHLYVPYASPEELRTDLEQWNRSAAAASIPAARTLAFPWGASLGTSDADYGLLESLGYIAVTRTYHDPQGRSQYWILPPDDLFHMRTVPGHPALWAVPDHYFPGRPGDLPGAKAVIDRVLLERGTTSLWAHSEEVASPEQVAVWDELLAYVATAREQGLWVAPLTEIVRYRNSLERIEVQYELTGLRLKATVHNGSDRPLAGLTLTLPSPVQEVRLNGAPHADYRQDQLRLPLLQAGETATVEVLLTHWESSPASVDTGPSTHPAAGPVVPSAGAFPGVNP